MIEFTDPFGRHTIFEFTVAPHKNRIGFVIRKERQSIYESLELQTVENMIAELTEIAKQVKNIN